jgi:Tfp pilus assembly protein PilW
VDNAGAGEAAPVLQPGQNAGVDFVQGTVRQDVDTKAFADEQNKFLADNPDKVMSRMADRMEVLTTDAEKIGATVNTNTLSGQATDYQKGKNQMAAMGELTGRIYKQNKKNPGVQALYDERVKRLNDRYNEVSALIEQKLKQIDQLYEKKSKAIDQRFNDIDKKLEGSGNLDSVDDKFKK